MKRLAKAMEAKMKMTNTLIYWQIVKQLRYVENGTLI
ncbi:hypothetical protein KSMBR1_3974 [Candidatus Kuenenia stuttgartiensis]|jgi:hypothetical protein|uniref:Uncharacterized protein n=1 Tax=Kuenenia stuttgartiensis TaxID=174633 RepID=A0A2C9CLB3_KUEST|nr:hypothetical protein KSMBR1_3974 [Candidatus Kuenenia stuttgartiensis]